MRRARRRVLPAVLVAVVALVATACGLSPLLGRVECGRLERAECDAAIAIAQRFLPVGHAAVRAFAADETCPPGGRGCVRFTVTGVRAVSVVVAYVDGTADTFSLTGQRGRGFDRGWLHYDFVPPHVGALIDVDRAPGRDFVALPLGPERSSLVD